MIAVPTPVTADRKADLVYVESAAKAISPHLKRGNLVIVESRFRLWRHRKWLRRFLKSTG